MARKNSSSLVLDSALDVNTLPLLRSTYLVCPDSVMNFWLHKFLLLLVHCFSILSMSFHWSSVTRLSIAVYNHPAANLTPGLNRSNGDSYIRLCGIGICFCCLWHLHCYCCCHVVYLIPLHQHHISTDCLFEYIWASSKLVDLAFLMNVYMHTCGYLPQNLLAPQK